MEEPKQEAPVTLWSVIKATTLFTRVLAGFWAFTVFLFLQSRAPRDGNFYMDIFMWCLIYLVPILITEHFFNSELKKRRRKKDIFTGEQKITYNPPPDATPAVRIKQTEPPKPVTPATTAEKSAQLEQFRTIYLEVLDLLDEAESNAVWDYIGYGALDFAATLQKKKYLEMIRNKLKDAADLAEECGLDIGVPQWEQPYWMRIADWIEEDIYADEKIRYAILDLKEHVTQVLQQLS